MTKKGSKKQTTAKTNGSPVTALSLAFVVGFHSPFAVNGFALTTTNPSSSYSLLFCQERQVIDRRRRRQRFLVELFSFVGDGGSDRPPPPGGGGKGGGGENRKSWDDFLNREGEETENLIKAREYMSENSLPISYGLSNTEEEESKGENGNVLSDKTSISRTGDSDEASSSALVANNIVPGGDPTLSPDMLSSNPYMAVVSKLSPSDLISKFTSTAHPRVQNAVRATILGLIGGLPKMAFDTSTITTGQKLASLMFQLQMTGYMFKNAEYRLSLQQSLDASTDPLQEDRTILVTSGGGKESRIDPLAGKIRGKLRVKYGGSPSPTAGDVERDPSVTGGLEMEVDAAAYMSELRSEVSKLRDELILSRKEKDDALRKDLLMYIRTLPQQELQSLTNTMSQDVLVAMKGLVNAVISGIGEGQIGPETVTEQSGEAMAQLCMWQLVIGYNLRTLEVREEMNKNWSGRPEEPDSTRHGVSVRPGSLE